MQLVTTPQTTPIAPTTTTVPGTVLGHGTLRNWDDVAKKSVFHSADIVAGAVLRAGVTDIRSAAWDLIRRGRNGEPRDNSGLVGFVRNGDVWDAVALLAPKLPGGSLEQLWSVGELEALRVATGIQLDAIWQISDYGGDMGWGTPSSMIPVLG